MLRLVLISAIFVGLVSASGGYGRSARREQAPPKYQQAPQSYEQAPQSYEQAPQSYEQAPQSYEQAPPKYEQASQSYEPAPQKYEPVKYEQKYVVSVPLEPIYVKSYIPTVVKVGETHKSYPVQEHKFTHTQYETPGATYAIPATKTITLTRPGYTTYLKSSVTKSHVTTHKVAGPTIYKPIIAPVISYVKVPVKTYPPQKAEYQQQEQNQKSEYQQQEQNQKGEYQQQDQNQASEGNEYQGNENENESQGNEYRQQDQYQANEGQKSEYQAKESAPQGFGSHY